MLFYFHIVLTGLVIAAASNSLAAVVGAPSPRYYPVVGGNGNVAGALALWLLAGPVALLRIVAGAFRRREVLSLFPLLALASAILWAFCLGVLLLELFFELFLA